MVSCVVATDVAFFGDAYFRYLAFIPGAAENVLSSNTDSSAVLKKPLNLPERRKVDRQAKIGAT